MAIQCFCGAEKIPMERGSKQDCLQTNQKEINGIKENDFYVLRTYTCPHCGRNYETIEKRDIQPQVMITNSKSKSKETFFQPTRYKNSIVSSVVDINNPKKVASIIFNNWLEKCEAEYLDREYTYSVEELIDFTVKELIKNANKNSAIKFLANIDVHLLVKYPELV